MKITLQVKTKNRKSSQRKDFSTEIVLQHQTVSKSSFLIIGKIKCIKLHLKKKCLKIIEIPLPL